MYGDSFSGTLYVANSGSGTISVINTTTNIVKQNTTVGKIPRYILPGPDGAIYVANGGSDGVSVIDDKTHKVVAGVTFDVSPFRGGQIVCNTPGESIEAPINRFLYVSSGTECVAKSNKGFEFSSWGQILEGNSTRTVSAAIGSPWTAFLDAINLKPDDPAATFTVNRFGNFTAYFRALPPAIPSEYLIPLYGIVISTVVGLSIPSIITWRKTKKQTSRLNSYHKEMTSLYDDGKLDESDTEHLNLINKNIRDGYSEGRINNEQYSNLKNEISVIYEKIFKKRIDALEESSGGGLNPTIHINKTKEDIRNAFSEGKITELHYNLLNERIAELTSKNDTPK